MTKLVIGNAEIVALPELGIELLEVRVDTGAKTSSLHVDNLVCFRENGIRYVSFDLDAKLYNLPRTQQCQLELKQCRKIKSSNGAVEHRCVVSTQIQMGDRSWPIELTLSRRHSMSYNMLLGREGMSDRVLVDPSRSYLLAA